MSSFLGRRGGRSRGGRVPYRGSNNRGGRYIPSGSVRQAGKGHGGDSITFSVCKYYTTGVCNRGDSCAHRHAVSRMFEGQVSDRQGDGSRCAVRSMVQWKDKPDHVFTACDDGTIKMWSTTDGSTWTQVTSVDLYKWRHVGAIQEADGALYVGHGMPYLHFPELTVDALRVLDLKGGSGAHQDVVNPALGFAHSHEGTRMGSTDAAESLDYDGCGQDALGILDEQGSSNTQKTAGHRSADRISCLTVIAVGGELRVYTGDDHGRILAWARPSPGAPMAQLAVLEGHARAITALVFTAANGMVWSASQDSTIRIWNVATNTCEHSITKENGGHTAGVVALALGQSAAEGALKDYIISASRDGTMGVFQTSDGAMTYKHKVGEGVTCLGVFDPTGGTSALLLVGYEDGTIAVRNFPEFALAFELHPDSVHTGHRKAVYSLLPFNNPAIDDSYFLSAGEEGSMICWRVHKLTDDRPGPGA